MRAQLSNNLSRQHLGRFSAGADAVIDLRSFEDIRKMRRRPNRRSDGCVTAGTGLLSRASIDCGVRPTTARCGMKGRDDLMAVLLDPGSHVAGVFTESDTAAAAARWSRRHCRNAKARAIITNAGNANAFTGEKGTRMSLPRAGSPRILAPKARMCHRQPG